jgi:hypothetical protein
MISTHIGQFAAVQEVELGTVPVGFDLRASPVVVENFSALRFRGEDRSLLKVDSLSVLHFHREYFVLNRCFAHCCSPFSFMAAAITPSKFHFPSLFPTF